MEKQKIILIGENLTIEDVAVVARNNAKVLVPPKVIKQTKDNWDAIGQMIKRGDIMYGLNTGIGGFGNVILPPEKTAELSVRMLRAHAAGYGNPVSQEVSRATLLARINVLAKGYSGVRPILFQTMVAMLNKRVNPVFYEKGSVGTSGDLAPIAQMGLVIIGEGEAYYQGKRMKGNKAMKKAGIKPVKLSYREGLAIMNGSQMMTGIACLNIYDGERLIKTAEISAAMTIDVLNCVQSAYSEKYNAVRPFKGQNDAAFNLRKLLEGSEIMELKKKNTQNAYSLRSVPQVSGACRDALDYIRKITEIELNSVADNPIFFTKEKLCLTGGKLSWCSHWIHTGFTRDNYY